MSNMALPVRVDLIPEDLRRANALFDVAQINEETARSVEIRNRAEAAAQEVFRAGASQDLHPEAEDLQTLFLEMCVGKENIPKIDVAAARREKIAPAQVAAPVGNDVIKGLLSDMHPDKRSGQSKRATPDPIDADEAYKALSGAKKAGDQLTEQSVVAVALTERTLSDPDSLSVNTIELVRYRSRIALEAGKTRFNSLEEIDAWKEQQIALLPIQQRGMMLVHITALFIHTLNPRSEGSVVLRGESAEFISRTLKEAQEQAQMMIDDSKAAEFLNDRFDVEKFDDQVYRVVEALRSAMLQHNGIGIVMNHAQERFCRELSTLCSNGPMAARRLGRYIMGSVLREGLFGSESGSPYSAEKKSLFNEGGPFKKIFSEKNYESPYENY